MMILGADLFCGGGGTSKGAAKAAKRRQLTLDLVAINHWPIAVETHRRNNPDARHVCADLASVEADPTRLVPGGRLHFLVGSPECTHFSVARGGKPCSLQSRASAWHIVHWAERLLIDELLIENVREFQTWGPCVLATGRPDPARKGETFRAFIKALESLGYTVEWKVLNAADYGDATTRKRLFVRASRHGTPAWPEPTHAGRWRPAREVIDWSLKGRSIFNRKRPLSPKTLRRIEAGLKKFGGEAFIAVLRGTNPSQAGAWAKPLNEPLGTISAGGIHAGLCQPFIIPMEHSGRQPVRDAGQPLPTITTARGGSFGLCQPFLLQVAHAGGDRVRGIEEPLPTIPAGHRGELAVCEPFVLGQQSVSDPCPTVTAKDRLALVEPRGMDILFRMLQPHELAAAMGFEGHDFAGTKTDAVRQIGNAVPVNTAEALCGAMFDVLVRRSS